MESGWEIVASHCWRWGLLAPVSENMEELRSMIARGGALDILKECRDLIIVTEIHEKTEC